MARKSQKQFEPLKIYESDLECCGYCVYMTLGNEQEARSVFCDGTLEIYVGACCRWNEFLDSLIHEIGESYLMKEGKRFANTKEPWEYSSINCIFVFNHMEYQLMCRVLGRDLGYYIPEMYSAWMDINKKYNKENFEELVENESGKKWVECGER